jgi:subtilisin family serine protease
VKIAILDTGADLGHPLLQPFKQAGQLGEHWDFVGKKEKIVDETGHGTHCLYLALQTAPRAKVYMARVFQRSVSDSATANAIAEVGVLTL